MAAEGGGGGFRMVYGGHGGSNCTSLTQTQRIPSSSQPLDPFFISGSSPSFLGSGSMVSFDDLCSGKRPQKPFFRTCDGDDNEDDDFDANSHQPEKKRRLTGEQVRFLERSFETDNKLEPERKLQLAKDLGLQPRQVSIWFQNRRARWKTKQLEKDFDILQENFNTLKTQYDILLKDKDKLKAEVVWLSDKLQLKETEIGVAADPSSATSDVLDSDSPHYVDGSNFSAFAEPIDDDSLNPTFLSSSVYALPKTEIFDDYPPGNSCHFASPVEDQDSWFFWSY